MKKGLMVFSNNMEDGEALFTRALLVRGGLQIDTVSIGDKEVKTSYGLYVKADYTLEEINLDTYEFLIVPGGKYVAEIIYENKSIGKLIQDFYKKQRLVTAICAGPRFLGLQGLLDNKQYTAYPGSEKDVKNGIYLGNLKVVKDGNVITGRSAGAVYEFAYEILKDQLGEEAAEKMYKNIIY